MIGAEAKQRHVQRESRTSAHRLTSALNAYRRVHEARLNMTDLQREIFDAVAVRRETVAAFIRIKELKPARARAALASAFTTLCGELGLPNCTRPSL